MKFDVVIVGAGIAGLSLAWTLHKAGKRILVVDRSQKAQGASVRNFGMVWPLGHPIGPVRDLALRSRNIWIDIAADVGILAEPCGSLTLAYEPIEEQVLREFYGQAGEDPHVGRLISPAEAKFMSPKIKTEGLRLALHSPTEVRVDPREVVQKLADYLTREGVEIRLGVPIGLVLSGQVIESNGRVIEAKSVVVCAGPDVRDLLPQLPREEGLKRCRLQMMRLKPIVDAIPRMGTHLCAGLTLGHYANFQECPSINELKAFHAQKWPLQSANGIHVLVSQHADGTLTVGDSHEYGETTSAYRSEEVDIAILAALGEFMDWSDFQVVERWDGYYNSSPGRFFSWAEVDERLWSLNLFGTGMTLSFGVAEKVAQTIMST